MVDSSKLGVLLLLCVEELCEVFYNVVLVVVNVVIKDGVVKEVLIDVKVVVKVVMWELIYKEIKVLEIVNV